MAGGRLRAPGSGAGSRTPGTHISGPSSNLGGAPQGAGGSAGGSSSVSGGVQHTVQKTGTPAHWEGGNFVQATGNYPKENPANVRREVSGGVITSTPSAPAIGKTTLDPRTGIPGLTLAGKTSLGTNVYNYEYGGQNYRVAANRPEDIRDMYGYTPKQYTISGGLSSEKET